MLRPAAISSSVAWPCRCRRSRARRSAAPRRAGAPRARPRRAASATILRVVEPRTIESSTTTSRLPAITCGERVELEPHAVLAQRLVGLDERAPDVAVLDQPVARTAGPTRARSPAPPACPSRARDHDVGLDRRLGREPLAHALALGVQRLAVHLGVRAARSRCARTRTSSRARRGGTACSTRWPCGVADQQLAGLELAHRGRRR